MDKPLPLPRRWSGQTVVIVASGPSLTEADVALARAWRRAWGGRAIAVNDAWRLWPDADVLYACDHDWWNVHATAVQDSAAEKWTQDRQAAARHGLRRVLGWTDFATAIGIAKPDCGPRWELSTDARYIGFGGNSGFQALNLAVHFGAARLVLLGFDMGLAPDGRRHFFGEHPDRLRRDSPYPRFIEAFERAAPVLEAMEIDVINASPRTALTCFRRLALAEALSENPARRLDAMAAA